MELADWSAENHAWLCRHGVLCHGKMRKQIKHGLGHLEVYSTTYFHVRNTRPSNSLSSTKRLVWCFGTVCAVTPYYLHEMSPPLRVADTFDDLSFLTHCWLLLLVWWHPHSQNLLFPPAAIAQNTLHMHLQLPACHTEAGGRGTKLATNGLVRSTFVLVDVYLSATYLPIGT